MLKDLLLTSPRTMHKKQKSGKKNDGEDGDKLSDLIEQDEEDVKNGDSITRPHKVERMKYQKPEPNPILTKSSNLSIDNSSIQPNLRDSRIKDLKNQSGIGNDSGSPDADYDYADSPPKKRNKKQRKKY